MTKDLSQVLSVQCPFIDSQVGDLEKYHLGRKVTCPVKCKYVQWPEWLKMVPTGVQKKSFDKLKESNSKRLRNEMVGCLLQCICPNQSI